MRAAAPTRSRSPTIALTASVARVLPGAAAPHGTRSRADGADLRARCCVISAGRGTEAKADEAMHRRGGRAVEPAEASHAAALDGARWCERRVVGFLDRALRR